MAALQLYPMGDRGGTATQGSAGAVDSDYTRWEIGGEPQQEGMSEVLASIIPDGRSGGNRNSMIGRWPAGRIIPDGRSGGNRNVRNLIYP